MASCHGMSCIKPRSSSWCSLHVADTANCLRSLQLVGEVLPLTVYCADDLSLELVQASGLAAGDVVPMHEEELGAFCAWKERGWARLMWLKCEAIRRALEAHSFVIFTDGDIVFQRAGTVRSACLSSLKQPHGLTLPLMLCRWNTASAGF